MNTRAITSDNYAAFTDELRALADEKYRVFQSKLIPNDESCSILGVRMPVLRQLAKEIGRGDPRSFLAACGDDYHEERMLRALVTARIKPSDYEELEALADSMLPYVSNWAVCDCFCMELKSVKRFREPFFEHIADYLGGDVRAQRAGFVLMLSHYLDDEYIGRVLERVDSVHSREHYVRMAQAWLLATALAKCPEQTLRFYESNSLDAATHNRAIQKACESFRIDGDTKAYLKTLKKR